MSDIPVFDDSPIPDVPVRDVAPATSHELHCKVCGVPLEYSGRGRKPVYCEEHRRKSGSSSSGGGAKTSKKTAELAAAATESLVQVNSLVGMGFMLAQMPMTASALASREEAFRTQAYAALQTDPALCQQILRAGQASARMTLIIAYASLGAAVAPYAASEIKEKRAAKAAEG